MGPPLTQHFQIQSLFPNEELSLRFFMRRRFNKSVISSLFRGAIVPQTNVPAERLARLLDQITLNIKQTGQFEGITGFQIIFEALL